MNHRTTDKRETGSDWLLPVTSLIFAGYYLYSIRELAWEAKVSAVCVAVILLALIIIFMVRSVITFRRGLSKIGFQRLYDDRDAMWRRLILFGLAISYILIVQYLGFTFTTFTFLTVAFRLLASISWVKTLMISLTLAIGGWLLFIVALGTEFPIGPFEMATRAVIGY